MGHLLDEDKGNDGEKGMMGSLDVSKDEILSKSNTPDSHHTKSVDAKPLASGTSEEVLAPGSFARKISVDSNPKDIWHSDGSLFRKDLRNAAHSDDSRGRREEERETSLFVGTSSTRDVTDNRAEDHRVGGPSIRDVSGNKVLSSDRRHESWRDERVMNKTWRPSNDKWRPSHRAVGERMEVQATPGFGMASRGKQTLVSSNRPFPTYDKKWRPSNDKWRPSNDKWSPSHRAVGERMEVQATPGFGMARGKVKEVGSSSGYTRGKLLDICRKQKIGSTLNIMPDGMADFSPITQVGFIEPLAFVAPDAEEKACMVSKQFSPEGVGDGLSKTVAPQGIGDGLSMTVTRILIQRAVITSMDFHPVQQTILLVGTDDGKTSLWEVSSRKKLASTRIPIIYKKSRKDILENVSITRVRWNHDGTLFGVTYSKHIFELFFFSGHGRIGRRGRIRHRLRIDAHVGRVNDLAFCYRTNTVLTCGDDTFVKVWDVSTGAILHTFNGHGAAVHSLCTQRHLGGKMYEFILSTSEDGQILGWFFGLNSFIVFQDAGSPSLITMMYSHKRLFSCGTNRDGKLHMFEWDDDKCKVKKTYAGLQEASLGVVQFDISRKYLAVADDHQIKVWDMDDVNLLTTIDAEGGLPATCIRFNKECSLLAVSTGDRIKVLATRDMYCALMNELVKVSPEQHIPSKVFLCSIYQDFVIKAPAEESNAIIKYVMMGLYNGYWHYMHRAGAKNEGEGGTITMFEFYKRALIYGVEQHLVNLPVHHNEEVFDMYLEGLCKRFERYRKSLFRVWASLISPRLKKSLFVSEHKPGREKAFHVPGGKMDVRVTSRGRNGEMRGEQPFETIRREMYEELGYKLNVTYYRYIENRNGRLYIVPDISMDTKFVPDMKEVHEAKWMEIDLLNGPIFAPYHFGEDGTKYYNFYPLISDFSDCIRDMREEAGETWNYSEVYEWALEEQFLQEEAWKKAKRPSKQNWYK